MTSVRFSSRWGFWCVKKHYKWEKHLFSREKMNFFKTIRSPWGDVAQFELFCVSKGSDAFTQQFDLYSEMIHWGCFFRG